MNQIGVGNLDHLGRPVQVQMGSPGQMQMGAPAQMQMGSPSSMQMGAQVQMGAASPMQMWPGNGAGVVGQSGPNAATPSSGVDQFGNVAPTVQ